MKESLLEYTKLTVPAIAKLYHVDTHKVRAWIRTGELRAIDASTHIGGRPRYLVSISDLEAFEQSREVIPACPTPRRVCRRRPQVKQYV